MQIAVNGEMKQVKDALLLSELLPELGIIQTAGLALAVNESVVARSQWDQFALTQNDKVLIIRATKGG